MEKDYRNYKFDLFPSELDHRDYNAESIYHTRIELPETFDYKHKLNPVRDQGRQGSCSAMTAAALKEIHEKKELGFKDYMSPQFIYNLRANKPSEGMTPRDTMKILHKHGVVPEQLYPYKTNKRITTELFNNAKNFRISGYAKVNCIYSAKSAILSDGLLYAGFPVYNPNNPMFWRQTNSSQPMLGGHAVAIVGWNKDSFIIRNSWGRDWGYNGYCYYPFEYWGEHWEIWTTIDKDSCMEKLEKMLSNDNNNKVSFICKLYSSIKNIFR